MQNTTPQRSIRFAFPKLEGESNNAHAIRERAFNKEIQSHNPSAPALLAQLLKRQARQVLHDVTTCPPHCIGAHIAGLKLLCEIIDHVARHHLLTEPERFVSGLQLAYPNTVMDFRACLDHALEHHRSPVSTSNDDVIHRLDLIAGMLMRLNCEQSSNVLASVESEVDL